MSVLGTYSFLVGIPNMFVYQVIIVMVDLNLIQLLPQTRLPPKVTYTTGRRV